MLKHRISLFYSLTLAAFLACALLTPFAWAQNTSIQERVDAAKEYMTTKQWSYASYQWRQILEVDPKNELAVLGLAESLTQSGLAEEAINHLLSARRTNDSPSIQVALGDAFAKAGRFLDAEKAYLAALKKRSYSLTAYQGLVDILPKLNQPNKGKLEQALRGKAEKAKKLAKDALRQNDYLKAAGFYAITAAFYRDNSAIVNDSALLYLLANKKKEAFDQFNKLSNKDNASWQTLANSALASLSVGQAKLAQEQMEKAIAATEDPLKRAQLYNNLGYIYELNQQYSRAQMAYQRAHQLDPALLKAQFNLAYILQKTHAYPEAIAEYREILRQQPNNADAWNRLGFAYELDFESEKAASAYEKAIQFNPKLKEAYFNLGTLYKKMGKQKKADAMLDKLATMEFETLEGAAQQPDNILPSNRLSQFVDLFFAQPDLSLAITPTS